MKNLTKDDKALLNALQEFGSCTPRTTSLAKKLRMAPSTINTKLRKFEKLGLVKGYTAVLNPEKLERGFVAFKLGGKKFHKPSDLEEYGRKLAAIPEIQEVHFVVGEWDYLCKMRVKDEKEYTEVAPKIAVLLDGCKGIIAPKMFKETHKILVK
jgi:Lrp/AsnC family leucine-responsive transcriptional regulator